MAADHARPPSTPPPAPPPPPVRTRNPIARFVADSFSTYGPVRQQRASASRPDASRERAGADELPLVAGVSAYRSQHASHRTGLDISALDISPERTHAVLAGRDILKTVLVAGAKCSEDTNLRSAIINFSSHNTRQARHRESLDIHDVKWSHGRLRSHIATAATNGKIVLYDLARAGVELARLHEHYRQVHKLAFNPHQGHYLLSGSQDASVRLWDLRDLHKERHVLVCRSQSTYQGQSEGIRDLRWSPTDGCEFAFGTDNGVIQRWDIRYTKGPKLKISAHDKTCHAIDWHPDGKHLISASSDKTVKVWDFSSEQRRQRPSWTLRTPYPVSNVRWRPPYMASGGQEKPVWQCTQFATSSEKHSPVYVWDFRRQHVPFREIARCNTPPTDMLWHSQHLLWTVGREGIFAQTDVQFAPKVLDRRNLQAFAVSPAGEVSAFSQKRPKRRVSDADYFPELSLPHDGGDRRSLADDSYTAISAKSSADDGIDDAFLRAHYRRHHGRTSSNRSIKSFGSTPPSSEDKSVRNLRDVLASSQKDSYRPRQVAFRGNLGFAAEASSFAYLAGKYKSTALKDAGAVSSYQTVTKAFDQNAEYAQRAAAYRISQSFRLMGVVVSYMLQQRAESMRRRRLKIDAAKEQRRTVRQGKSFHVKNEQKPAGQGLLPKNSNHLQRQIESSSNVATPLAKPQQNSGPVIHASVPPLSDLEKEETISLPPPVAASSSAFNNGLLQQATQARPPQLPPVEFNGPDWFPSAPDLAERRAINSAYRQQPKAPLNLEAPDFASQTVPINIPPPLDRHDSNESFAMFSTSSDSRAFSAPGSFASSKSLSKQMDTVPEDREAVDSVGSDSPRLWRSGSNRSILGGSSDKVDQGSWPEMSSLRISSGSIKDVPAILPPRNERDKVRFQESQEGSSSAHTTPEHGGGAKLIANANTPIPPPAAPHIDASQMSGSGSHPSQGTWSGTWSTSNSSSNAAEPLEASGTIVPDEPTERLSSPHAVQPPGSSQNSNNETRPPVRYLGDPASQSLILADYLDGTVDDAEASAPFTIIDLLQELLTYHTENLSDAQTASHLLLLVSPLMPPSRQAQDPDISSQLLVYGDYLSNLGLPPRQVQETLSTSLRGLVQCGLRPLQVESILSTYHDQLMAFSLFNAAAKLRRVCYPAFPAVYEQSIKGTSIGLLCKECGSQINNPKSKMRCESCLQRQAPCPVCWCSRPAIELLAAKSKKGKRKKSRTRASSFAAGMMSKEVDASAVASSAVDIVEGNAVAQDAGPQRVHAGPVQAQEPSSSQSHATLWLTCPMCNHSGHLSCLSAWFAAEPADASDLSQGACPSPGCTCDCAPGSLRDDRVRRMEQVVARRERERGVDRSKVSRDEWRVGESRAVSQVRGMVDAAAALGAPRDGRDARQDKRVRLVEPQGSGVETTTKPSRKAWVMGN